MIEKIRNYFRENGIIDKECRINVDFLVNDEVGQERHNQSH